MKQLSNDEIKKILLSLMTKIDKLCRENDLQYQLFAGTLIGAVRHKGFIPWDDDIDIVMPRKDYNKLAEIVNKSNLGIKYISYETNKNYPYAFAKVYDTSTIIKVNDYREISDLGLYIDIFPLDNQCPDLKTAKKDCIKLQWLNAFIFESDLLRYRRTSKKIYHEIPKIFIYPIAKLTGTELWLRKMDRLAQKYKNTSSPFCGVNVDPHFHTVFRKTYFSKSIECDFEGHKFYIPIGYDKILKINYGDYMKLPPPKQRVSEHNLIAYYK